MTRLVVFLGLILGLIGALSLASYQNITIDNTPFDFNKALEVDHARKLALNPPHHEKNDDENAEEIKDTTKKIPIELNTPELQLGYETYNKKKCQTCHGNFGEGKKSQLAPRIAGQLDWYIEEQILAIRDGQRINGKMLPYVKKITEEEAKSMAHFLSQLP